METADKNSGKKFVYERLGSSHSTPLIRLVELKPAALRSDMIELSLQTVGITSCPSYEALSYCWGNSVDYTTVLCDRAQLDITESLEKALLYLRQPDEPRLLWIDQIAINQADNEEKSHQILCMRDIYVGAQRTIIWLGEPTPDSDLAITFANRLLAAFMSNAISSKDLSSGKAEADSPHAPSVEEFLALASLLQRPWFGRAWVLQEVAVSGKADIVCGDQEVGFDNLIAALFFSMALKNFLKGTRPEWIHNIFTLTAVRTWSGEKKEELAFLSLLLATRVFRATDPRDKIFALCGITSTDLKVFDIKPDYQSPTPEIYTHAAYSILHNNGNLDLLEVPHGQSELSDHLPSWVPDWSDSSIQQTSLTLTLGGLYKSFLSRLSQNMTNAMTGRLSANGGIAAAFNNLVPSLEEESNDIIFTATKTTKSIPQMMSDQSLVLSGHVVDRIDILGGTLVAPITHSETKHAEGRDTISGTVQYIKTIIRPVRDFIQILMEWDDIAVHDRRFRNKPYPTGESQTIAFGKTLCAGWATQNEKEMETAYQDWRKAFRRARLLRNINSFPIKMPRSKDLILVAAIYGLSADSGGAHEFANGMDHSLQRRLARTRSGRLALVPPEAKPGDAVALLEGGSVPYVLRESGSSWKLVGGSYVHGIMNGEAFDEDSCGSICLI